MSTYKLFDTPQFHDAEWYRDRPVADHLHEVGHRERLFRTLADVGFIIDIDPNIKGVSDLGCGNGGLLWELARRYPLIDSWGYDLSPKAVEWGKRDYKVNIFHADFVNDFTGIRVGEVVVMSEVLEHLVDPVALLTKLRNRCRWLVVSCPSQENQESHYEFHLWAWDKSDFAAMFSKLGYEVMFHYDTPLVTSQFLVAFNPPRKA